MPRVSTEHSPLLGNTSQDEASQTVLPAPASQQNAGSGHGIAASFKGFNRTVKAVKRSMIRSRFRAVQVLSRVLFCSGANVLLPVLVLGFVLCGFFEIPDPAKFTLMFFAIIPLAAILSDATESVAEKQGDLIGGLMNATCGNIVEMIVSGTALYKGQIRIVQQNMLGSVLSNLLLVLGCCFITSGLSVHAKYGFGEMAFKDSAAGAMATLMLCACIALIIPSLLAGAMGKGMSVDASFSKVDVDRMLTLSRGSAVLLMVFYVIFLFFTMKTHAHLFDEAAATERAETQAIVGLASTVEDGRAEYNEEFDGQSEMVDEIPSVLVDNNNDDEDGAEVDLTPFEGWMIMSLITGVIMIAAGWLVDSISGVVESGYLSEMFIGLILIPIVGNAAEHVSSCFVAAKGKMDLAVGIALGSSVQIALFVTPFLVVLGWALGQPMTMQFGLFGTGCLFLSVLAVGWMVMDGRTNYFEGVMCIGIYMMIGLACWVFPDDLSATVGTVSEVVASAVQA